MNVYSTLQLEHLWPLRMRTFVACRVGGPPAPSYCKSWKCHCIYPYFRKTYPPSWELNSNCACTQTPNFDTDHTPYHTCIMKSYSCALDCSGTVFSTLRPLEPEQITSQLCHGFKVRGIVPPLCGTYILPRVLPSTAHGYISHTLIQPTGTYPIHSYSPRVYIPYTHTAHGYISHTQCMFIPYMNLSSYI